MTGTLYLVGTGPGDPELLTLKAVRILGSAHVIVYPRKAGEASLSLRIARDHLNPGSELLPADIPMAAEREPARLAYDVLADKIWDHLNLGKNVAYLCEGDPLFYGSAMYLIERLASSARIEVVPGITSLAASAAAISRPLAARNEILKVLPAPLDDETLRAELEGTAAAAIIKVGRHFDRVRKVLEETGHAANAMIVEHATADKQCITPLMEFAAEARPYFSTILCYRGQESWGR